MEAEKQSKEHISRILHLKSDSGNMGFVDNRPQEVSQSKLINSIQRRKNSIGLSDNKKIGIQGNYKMIDKPIKEVVQCIVKEDGRNIKKKALLHAVIKAIKQGLVPNSYYTFNNQTSKYNLTPNGETAVNILFNKYLKITLILNNRDSLICQVGQDLNLISNGDNSIVGTPYQFNEYAVKPEDRVIGHDLTDMRIFRAMPLYAWEQASLSGHGGSLGEAVHYFRIGKKDTERNSSHVFVLVEFRLHGKSLNTMVGEITTGGEGVQSSDQKFGGKNESSAAFGLKENFFSVDLKHAKGIINKPYVSSRVVASTNDIMPNPVTKPGSVWTEGRATKPTYWT